LLNIASLIHQSHRISCCVVGQISNRSPCWPQ